MMLFFKKDLRLVRRNAMWQGTTMPCPQSINYSIFFWTLVIKSYMLQQPHLSGQYLFKNIFYVSWSRSADITAYSIWSRLWWTALHWVAAMSFLLYYIIWPISILLIMILIRRPYIIINIPVSLIMKPIMEDRTSRLWRLQCTILLFRFF